MSGGWGKEYNMAWVKWIAFNSTSAGRVGGTDGWTDGRARGRAGGQARERTGERAGGWGERARFWRHLENCVAVNMKCISHSLVSEQI